MQTTLKITKSRKAKEGHAYYFHIQSEKYFMSLNYCNLKNCSIHNKPFRMTFFENLVRAEKI